MASAPLYGPQVVSKTALSPQDLVRLQLAQQLLKSGTDTSPVESPWQGVARLGQALAGGYLNYRLGEDQKQRQGETTNAMANALRAGSATWTNPMGGTEEAPPGAGPLPGAPIAPGQSVPIPGAVGGMQGIIASLAGSNSPEAQAKGADLAFTQMTEQQKLANALKQDEGQWQNKIKYQPQLAAEEFNATAPLKLNLRQSELDQDLRHKPTLAGLEANARLPSQMSLAGFTANANAQAGLSVAEQKAAAEARGAASARPPGFQGNDLNAQMLNIVRNAEAKVAAGQQLSPQEQHDLALAKRHLEAPQVVGTPETGFTQVNRPPLPAYPGSQPTGQPQASTVAPIAPPNLKDIPGPINTAMLENVAASRKVDKALKALEADPAATGWKGYVPPPVLNRMDPTGVDARAAVADIGSLLIHDRSGAAVSVKEFPRLAPFVPSATDDYATVVKKVKRFAEEYKAVVNDMAQVYSPSQGYKENPVVRDFLKSAQQSARPTATGPNGEKLEYDGANWVPVSR